MKRDINWFVDIYHSGQLNLDPPYQRRSVWTQRDRRFFLDTIFRNYPCPAVFLYKEVDQVSKKMIYHVVDGKQRLETILLFVQNNIALDRTYGDERLDGKKWKSIENDPELKRRFQDYAVTVEFISDSDGPMINEIFDRLNRTSRKLERQELRHAKYDGWFISLSEKEAEKEEWERLGVVTKARMRRMKDVQCISELLAVLLKNCVLGYSQDTLDDLYAEYDSPVETVPDFDEEEFKKKIDFAKNYVLRMEDHNEAVTKYAKGLGNFYSLWSFIALNLDRVEAPEIAAEKYADFMNRVLILTRGRDIRFLKEKEYEDDSYSLAFTYLKNSVPSGTDESQRKARHQILERVLLDGHVHEKRSDAQSVESSALLPHSWGSEGKSDQGEYILKLIMGKSNGAKEK
ncbi:MAG: DUF262 domain-containing protein [Nitrospirota bacterium]